LTKCGRIGTRNRDRFGKKIEESNEKWAETLRRQREKDAESHKEKTAKLQRDLDELKSNKPGWVESTLQAVSLVALFP